MRLWLFNLLCAARLLNANAETISASSTQPGCKPSGARDGNRLSTEPGHCWKSDASSTQFWQLSFPSPVSIGAILQVQGDHDFVFTNAPLSYAWFVSDNGSDWRELIKVEREQRIFRLHRLRTPIQTRHLQFRSLAVHGAFVTLREVEVYPAPDPKIEFPPWALLVNSTHDSRVPNHGREFLPILRSCSGWSNTPAQQIWAGDFAPEFVDIEPRPLCAFLSGSFKDWCEVDRRTWRGAERVLKQATLPMWASCGGAQALAILAETGTDKPWDCPHCRDPKNPKLPIYTHIGHTGTKPCGDYSACTFERGPHHIRIAKPDPVFNGLPEEFIAMQSHCGQIEWTPKGWELIATAGSGTRTLTQCLRLKSAPIYAAQFHIEMDGTPETSRIIMSNFLAIARDAAKR
jgi:hypothetical protein